MGPLVHCSASMSLRFYKNTSGEISGRVSVGGLRSAWSMGLGCSMSKTLATSRNMGRRIKVLSIL